MMKSIFISYRRSDSADATGRIAERLARRVGAHRVFKDVDSIAPGENFDDKIRLRLGSSKVVVAVIGETWLETTDTDGRRRLDDPEDYVRRELAQALASRSVRVIPVLIGEARLPDPAELPPELRQLCSRQAVRIRRDPNFQTDIERLLRLLPRTGALLHSALAAAALLVVSAAGAAVIHHQKTLPIDLTRGAKETVVVVCIFAQTGESSRVILPADIDPAAAAKLLQERVYIDPGTPEKLQWMRLLTPTILMDDKPLSGASLREAGVKHGSRLKLAVTVPKGAPGNLDPTIIAHLPKKLLPAADMPEAKPPVSLTSGARKPDTSPAAAEKSPPSP